MHNFLSTYIKQRQQKQTNKSPIAPVNKVPDKVPDEKYSLIRSKIA